MTMKLISIMLTLVIICVTNSSKGQQQETNAPNCTKLIYKYKCDFIIKKEVNKKNNCNLTNVNFYSLNDENCVIFLRKCANKSKNRHLKCISSLDYPIPTCWKSKGVNKGIELICKAKRDCNRESKNITIINNNGSLPYSFVLRANESRNCHIINDNIPDSKNASLNKINTTNDGERTTTVATNLLIQENTTTNKSADLNKTSSILPRDEANGTTSEKAPISTINNYFIPDDSLKRYLQANLAFTIIFFLLIVLGTLIFLRRRNFRWKMKNSMYANSKLQENITASNRTEPRHKAHQEGLNECIYANLVDFPSQKRSGKAVEEEALPLQTRNTLQQQTKMCAPKEPEVVYTQVIVTRESSPSRETKVPHYDVNNVTYAASIKRNPSIKRKIIKPNQHRFNI